MITKYAPHQLSKTVQKRSSPLPNYPEELGLVSGLGFAGAGGMQVKNEELYILLTNKKIVQQIDLSVCHL